MDAYYSDSYVLLPLIIIWKADLFSSKYSYFNIHVFVAVLRVLLSIYVSIHPGLGGELDCLSDVDEELCLQCIEANRDMVVGVKLRLTSDIANNGKHEVEAFR